MNFINPQDCGCECVPVEVTCEIDGSDFNYTVENALTAELRRYETPYDIETDAPDEVVSVSLTNGSASGTWAISGASDTYCIYAENACSSETCCKECEVPYCTAELVTDDPALGSYDYGVRWTVGKRFAGDSRLDTVEFDGNTTNIVGDPMSESGIGLYNFGDSSVGNEICVQVTNACGHTATCCIQIPCCYRVSAIVFDSANFADILESCTFEPMVPITGANGNGFRHEYRVEVNGLGSINGTQVISLPTLDGTCPYGLYATGVMGTILDRYIVTYVQHTFPLMTNLPEDSCGNNLDGVIQVRVENNWTGEYWWEWGEFTGLRLKFIPTSGSRVTKRPRPPSECITDSPSACSVGSIWGTDSDFCIIDHTQDPSILTNGTLYIGESLSAVPVASDCFTAPSTRGTVFVQVDEFAQYCTNYPQPTNFGAGGYMMTTPCHCTDQQDGETKIYFQ